MSDDDDIFDIGRDTCRERDPFSPFEEEDLPRENVRSSSRRSKDPFSPWHDDETDRRKARTSSNRKWIFAGMAIVAFLAIVAVVAVQMVNERGAPLAPRGEETADERFAAAAAAFNGEPADLNDPRVAQLSDMIEQFRLALKQGNAGLIGDMIDAERLLREAERKAATSIPYGQFDDLARTLKLTMSGSLAQNDLMDFERFEISRVELNAEGNEALLYVRQWHVGNVLNKFRYWAAHDGNRWRIYDFEDLAMSIRTSDLMAISTIPSDVPTWQLMADIPKIQNANSAMASGDFATAEQELNAINVHAFPAPIQATTHMIRANIALWRGDSDLAMREVEIAQSLHPDLVALQYQRAVILNSQARYEEALAAGRDFLEKLGGDANASLEIAIALQGLGRQDEALAAVREGLDDDPSSIDLLIKLAEIIPTTEAVELGERFMKLPDPQAWLVHFGNSAWYYPESMWAVISAYRETHPDDVDAAYYGADALMRLSRNEEAFELLAPYVFDGAASLEIDPAALSYNAENVEYLYYSAAVEADRWQDAYDAADDKSVAFATLAEWMVYDVNSDLRDLVDRHASAIPDDPQLPRYQASIAGWDGDWDTAVEILEAELEAADEETALILLPRWTQAMFQSGRAIEAVESATPENGIFSQLMGQACSESAPPIELMEELLVSYASQNADEEDVKYWTIRLAYLQNDYAKVLALVEQHAALLQSGLYGWDINDLVIYSHLHLEQYEAAASLADQVMTISGDPLRRAIVAAAQRDLDETRLWLDRCIEYGYLGWQFYDVEFLKEALHSEEFASLREQYPPSEPEEVVE